MPGVWHSQAGLSHGKLQSKVIPCHNVIVLSITHIITYLLTHYPFTRQVKSVHRCCSFKTSSMGGSMDTSIFHEALEIQSGSFSGRLLPHGPAQVHLDS